MYEHMTDGFLRERMLSRVPDKLDKRPSALIYDTIGATANELAILYIELEYLIKNSYGDTAAREYLVLLCKDRGIVPEPATHAVLKGVFTPDTIDVTGRRFNIGDVNYEVIERISPGQYQVRCETFGTIGNQYLGRMIPMDYIQGLETAELTEILVPGEDEEETEVLRQRYFDSFKAQSFGGNCADYLAKVRGMEGIGDAKVARVWNGGIRPADMVPTDAVSAWYDAMIGSVPEEVAAWLSAVYMAACEKKLTVGGTVRVTVVNSNDFGEASGLLVDRVQTALDPESNAGEGCGLAPIGHVVSVVSARPVEIKVETTLAFDEGYGWGNLRTSIQEAVEGYLLELRKGWAESDSITVRVSQIEARILGVEGVADISGTMLNGAAGNISINGDEIPVMGGVSGW